MGTVDIITASTDVIKAAVFYTDVADVPVVIQADDKYAKFTFLACDVFQMYVTHDDIIDSVRAND